MDRSEILQMMAALQLSGMRAAYDEIVTTGIKRKHSIDHIIAALLKAEIAEKHARSIRYQMGIAKLPLAKELADFAFADTPINEQLVRDLAGGNFLSQQRNVVAVGGTGTGKSHIAIGITRSCAAAPVIDPTTARSTHQRRAASARRTGLESSANTIISRRQPHAIEGRIASSRMLPDKLPLMTGAASPNRVGGADGGTDQHGRAARGVGGCGGALPVGRKAREGSHSR